MSILIIGGGICGLGAALLQARDGHDVTILERDPSPPLDSLGDAWNQWNRSGVAQFRQPHKFMCSRRWRSMRICFGPRSNLGTITPVQEILRTTYYFYGPNPPTRLPSSLSQSSLPPSCRHAAA